jgi:hypothetical protein
VFVLANKLLLDFDCTLQALANSTAPSDFIHEMNLFDCLRNF